MVVLSAVMVRCSSDVCVVVLNVVEVVVAVEQVPTSSSSVRDFVSQSLATFFSVDTWRQNIVYTNW